jgi:hypothetical protein
VSPSIITLQDTVDSVIFIFDTTALGFILDSNFEIIAIGKFQ